MAEATGTAIVCIWFLISWNIVVWRSTSDGTIQAVQLYAPYGSVRSTDGSMPTPSNFTGQRLDTQIGLLYYNSRYYDPVSGRFTSTDTVQTNAQGADTYAYVNDNPIGSTDPTGHCPWCIIGAVAGALIGAGIDYGMQVYNNYQNGASNPWTDVNWWDVGGAALMGGLIGFGLGPLIPAVGAMIGGAVSTGSVGAGLAAGGGAFAAASGWLSGGVSSPEATQPEVTQPETTPETSDPKVNINPNKFKYLFGDVTSGNEHNIERSRQVAWYMKSLGINDNEDGKALLTDQLTSAAQDTSNTVNTEPTQWGLRINKDLLLFGPSGKIYKISTGWMLRDFGILDFITLIPHGRNPAEREPRGN